MKFTLIKGKNMNKDTLLNDNATDDSNLAQCEYCNFIEDWDSIPNVSDPYCSDGTVTCCPICNQGESFTSYKP